MDSIIFFRVFNCFFLFTFLTHFYAFIGFPLPHFVAFCPVKIMDSYPSLIPIKHVLKVFENRLETELKAEKDEIISEAKKIEEIPDLECRIDLQRITKRDDAGEEKDMFVAYLTLLNIGEDVEINSSLVFCIKTANFLKYDDGYLTSDAHSFGTDVCNFADLFDSEKKFIVDGEFVIEIKGIIFLKKKEMKIVKSDLTKYLLQDEDERDFTIVVKEDDGCKTEIKIHKLILAVRSPVFKKMFKTDMKEKQEGKVEITDFDLDTVETAIEFCYDKDIFENYFEWEELINLQKFADKYDIEDLKSKTECKLVEEKISPENICGITNAAINLNAPKLQEFCFRFLLLASREGIPIKDIESLENGIALELFRKSFTDEYC